MATYSFADHLNAYKLFHTALSELRALIEQDIDAEKAFDLIIRAYTNPLVRKFYAPVLHSWAKKLTPPTPEPVRTYQEELTSALAQIDQLKQELAVKEEEVTSLRAQVAVEAGVKPSEAESIPVTVPEVEEKEQAVSEEVHEVVL